MEVEAYGHRHRRQDVECVMLLRLPEKSYNDKKDIGVLFLNERRSAGVI